MMTVYYIITRGPLYYKARLEQYVKMDKYLANEVERRQMYIHDM